MKIIKMGLGNSEEAYIERDFSDGINIIFSDDNNKGKTIVTQSIMYSIGNKPTFPSSFDYKNYYYYLEFEENRNKFIVVRRGDSYVVSYSDGIRFFEDYSEFKNFWNSNVFALPQISLRGTKRIVDMELFSQLFFVGQDGKDTSTIFNSGFYHKDDFINMLCSYAGEFEAALSEDEIVRLKTDIKALQAKRVEQIKLSDFYKTSTTAKEYLSRIQDQKAFHDKICEMEEIAEKIAEIRKIRNRLATKRTLWNGTLKELHSLNRNIEVGELRCMDCNSTHIAYKGKGKITYSFDVSTPEMRTQIIKSIDERIFAYNEEIEKCDYEISSMQQQMEGIMQEEDITIENILAYKNGFSSITEIEETVKQLDTNIKELKQKIEVGKKQTDDSKQAQRNFYKQVIEKMNQIKEQIDIDSEQLYDDLFTKRGSVVSGSEETVYYIARLISIAKLTKHGCPIVMDSFRAEDLSTDKENRTLALFSDLNCQCILTTTLKDEERDKYVKMPGINAIDYTGHQSNKILGKEDLIEFTGLLNALGISMQ